VSVADGLKQGVWCSSSSSSMAVIAAVAAIVVVVGQETETGLTATVVAVQAVLCYSSLADVHAFSVHPNQL
jgi:hypothetical protein